MPQATMRHNDHEVLTPEAEQILNNRERARREAAAKRANTAPLGIPEEALPADLPDVRTPAATPAPEVTPRTLVMSITILYRGRQITISSEGRTLDQFCDLLDSRLGAPS